MVSCFLLALGYICLTTVSNLNPTLLNMKKNISFKFFQLCFICVFILADLSLVSCKKKKDTEEPLPIVPVSTSEKKINISTLRSKFASNPSANYKFQSDSMLYCTVIADEVSGNFFKELFVRDGSGSIRLKLRASSSLLIGDSIKLNIKDAYLNSEFDLIQLDSVNANTMITKITSGLNPQPEIMTIEQLIANTTATNPLQSRLVRINNAEFTNFSFPTFADPLLFAAKNHTIQSCSPAKLTVRTSGYANFASSVPPAGNGSIIGIVSQYGAEVQLRIRKLAEVSMTGTLCNTNYLSKNFNDNSITSGGWSQQLVTGNVSWITSTFSGTTFAVCNNYSVGVNTPCESWMISPSMNLSGSTNPNLYFQNSCNFTGPLLEVYVSTDYTSGSPQTASWTQLSPTLSGGSYVYVNSGALSLTPYKTNNTRIGFKYIGTGSAGRAWQVDDIVVKEN